MGIRKVTIGPCTLYLCDCRKVLANIKADAVVTDPPYGINYKSGPNSSKSISTVGKRFTRKINGDAGVFDLNPILQFSPVILTGAQYLYDRLPAGGSIHCWDKRGNYKPLDQADADMIWCSEFIRSRVFHLAWRGLCRHAENREKILHPTQKPVALMEWMMSLLKLPEKSVVLDPYMGAGTTGIACIRTGRKFIGIENDPEFFEIALNRIRTELKKG